MASRPNLAVIHRYPITKIHFLKTTIPNLFISSRFWETNAFGATFSGMVWVDKHYLWWLVNSCLDQSHLTLTSTNHNSSFSTQKSQKSLRRKLVPIPLKVSGVTGELFVLRQFSQHRWRSLQTLMSASKGLMNGDPLMVCALTMWSSSNSCISSTAERMDTPWQVKQ